MKRILLIGLSLLVAFGCADSKPVATTDNSSDESAATSDSGSQATAEADTTVESESNEAEETQSSNADVVDSSEPEDTDTEANGEFVADDPASEPEAEVEVELSLSDQYKKMVSDFRLQVNKLRQELRQATTAEEQEKIQQTMMGLQPQLALDVKEAFAGKEDDPAFLDALPLLVISLPDSDVGGILAKVEEHHLDSEQWFDVCVSLSNVTKPSFVNFIERQATNGSGKSQAGAQFVLASTLNPETDEQRVVEMLQSVIDFGGELLIRGQFDLKAQAEDKLFVLTKLGIGKEAPEIEGEDADGVAFKLSDYRGKVVLLDFWGNW